MSHYPKAYMDYLLHFHTTRDFFECHEILEAYWKKQRFDPLRLVWLGLIQTAVGSYHYRRGNMAGAEKMLQRAIANFANPNPPGLGIDWPAFQHLLEERLRSLREGDQVYVDLDIPLTPELACQCQELCQECGQVWGNPSDLTDECMVHKHIMRDRSAVIASRNLAKERKVEAREVRHG